MDTLARCFDAEPVSRWLFSILILCSNTLPECPGCRAVQGGDWEQGLVVSVANNEVFSCELYLLGLPLLLSPPRHFSGTSVAAMRCPFAHTAPQDRMLSGLIAAVCLVAAVSAVPCGSNWQIQCTPYTGLNSSVPLYQTGSFTFNGINAGDFKWGHAIFTSSGQVPPRACSTLSHRE